MQVVNLNRNEIGTLESRYPDSSELRNRIASMFNVDKDQVLLGSGITGVFKAVCAWLSTNGVDEMQCSRMMYKGSVRTLEDSGFKILDRSKVARLSNNPSNPFGKVEYLPCDSAINIYDEAYIEFEGGVKSATCYLERGNTIVMRTLSKAYGLASIRVGYAIVSKNIADSIGGFDCGNSLSAYSILCAMNAFDSSDIIDNIHHAKITRRYLEKRLIQSGYDVSVSTANFVVANVPNVDRFKTKSLLEYGTTYRRVTTSSFDVIDEYINCIGEKR